MRPCLDSPALASLTPLQFHPVKFFGRVGVGARQGGAFTLIRSERPALGYLFSHHPEIKKKLNKTPTRLGSLI